MFKPAYVFAFSLLFTAAAPLDASAECRVWVKEHVRANGTVVKGHFRTCPDGDKNNNYGRAEYPNQPARQRDADGDGLPNHLDRDDNNNGLSDNVDHALGKILASRDLRQARVPQFERARRYGDFPIYQGKTPRVIVLLEQMLRSTSSYQWRQSFMGEAECLELTPQGAEIGRVHQDYCRAHQGRQFRWSADLFGSATCEEATPDGMLIAQVDKNYCRAYQGRSFEWNQDLFGQAICQEVTPEGVVIQGAHKDACRAVAGSRFEWSTDIFGSATCQEVTLEKVVISSAHLDRCRYPSDTIGNVVTDILGSVITGASEAKPSVTRNRGIAEQGPLYLQGSGSAR